MTTVNEASEIVNSIKLPMNVAQLPIMEAVGKVVQEDIIADRNFPPFNRVAMDGIAVNFSSIQNGISMVIEDVQFAGIPQKQLKESKNCIEAMTGAVLPLGCDTVIKYEDIEILEKASMKIAKIKIFPGAAGENVHKEGSDRKTGDILIAKGKIISAAEIAVACTVGKAFVKVIEQPRIAIISTGDELVEPSATPHPHQIRKSNVPALKAALQERFYKADDFHLPDEKDQLYKKIHEILDQYDVLILSGGVSMGKADFVPDILDELGVKKLFHKVAQRPGKPFWFGTRQENKIVFALPGNPVSTFLTFFKYFLPWMRQQVGQENKQLKAVLTEDVSFAPPLTYFLQVKVRFSEDGKLLAVPHSGKGSGDLANLSDCDGFLELASGDSKFIAGSCYPLILFKNLIP